MDWIGLLYGFGILQGLVLATVLCLTPSGHPVANRFMAALVIAIGTFLIHSWLIRSGYFLRHPTAWTLLPSLIFSWGPLLFFYVHSMTGHSIHSRQMLHFLPALLLTLITTVSFWQESEDVQRSFLQYFWSPRDDIELITRFQATVPRFWQLWTDWHVQGNLFALHFAGYCLIVLRQIRNHNARLVQHYSSVEEMNLRWLHTLTLACLVFVAVYMLFNRTTVLRAGYFNADALAPSVPFLFLVVLVYIIGIAATFQSNLIRGLAPVAAAAQTRNAPPQTEPAAVATEQVQPSTTTKYARSGLSDEDAEAYKQRLISKMESERYYLDCDLTLPDLAQAVDLTPHQVSQVINERLNQSFFTFVSEYRIELAKQMMANPKTRQMPIVDLAMEVGFKSKSSFYNAFKKFARMTPTQYKKTLPTDST
ncbi:helix-turn-helix transcriptional regulator [Pseudomaricurvus alkylphenolicus]|jgi:AraC-like DNA-binding protein|uniref:helix-turn-helix domain-containing protein n=1 Tax=Pseudomaricurvus alkylphenolicus TaxID=1306991 RepID=UPI0014236D7B|nr:AraC family transcriptional regulator [Pseudomaricurvus alkylphenolicus]NIB42975.1 helix-turn-helix transcriptional regulator [Pseudomaricurvus alkylphenolicus]